MTHVMKLICIEIIQNILTVLFIIAISQQCKTSVAGRISSSTSLVEDRGIAKLVISCHASVVTLITDWGSSLVFSSVHMKKKIVNLTV